MNYVKKIEFVEQKSYHSRYRGTLNFYGPNSGLRAGFEIEKSTDLGEMELDSGFVHAYELDSSCGTEYVTHVFNVSCAKELKKALRQKENVGILRQESDGNCGGHINISVQGKNGAELMQMLRGHVALLYSLYCDRLESNYVSEDSHRPSSLKYSPIRLDDHMLEFRIFPAIKSAQDLIKRVVLLRKMYNSAKSGESASDFIERFFNGNFYKKYLNEYEQYYKDGYKNLALSFMKCLLNNEYTYNIGKKHLLRYFNNENPSGEMIKNNNN